MHEQCATLGISGCSSSSILTRPGSREMSLLISINRTSFDWPADGLDRAKNRGRGLWLINVSLVNRHRGGWPLNDAARPVELVCMVNGDDSSQRIQLNQLKTTNLHLKLAGRPSGQAPPLR